MPGDENFHQEYEFNCVCGNKAAPRELLNGILLTVLPIRLLYVAASPASSGSEPDVPVLVMQIDAVQGAFVAHEEAHVHVLLVPRQHRCHSRAEGATAKHHHLVTKAERRLSRNLCSLYLHTIHGPSASYAAVHRRLVKIVVGGFASNGQKICRSHLRAATAARSTEGTPREILGTVTKYGSSFSRHPIPHVPKILR